MLDINKPVKCYGGCAIDSLNIQKSSSGGIATAFSVNWINEGGYVVGVKYTSDFRSAKYEITRNIDDLDSFRGSKYIDAIIGDTFYTVKQLLDQKEKVLFFGLPCKVAALLVFLKRDYSNLMTVELVCHGTLPTNIHSEYIDYIEKKYKSELKTFSTRGKKKRWLPYYITAEFNNGKKLFEEFYKTPYGVAFIHVNNERCYSCRYKGDNLLGDIQIGDFWGVDVSQKFYNEKGTSCIIVRSEKGENFVSSNNLLRIEEISFESIVSHNKSIIQVNSKNYKTLKYLNDYKKNGIIYAAKKNTSFMKKVSFLIPRSLKSFLKKCFGK